VCELTGVKPACAMKVTAGILAPATDLSTERDLSLSIPVRTRKMVQLLQMDHVVDHSVLVKLQ